MKTAHTVQLPSMPGTVVRLLQMFSDPEIGMNDVIDVVRTDAALSARILKAANGSSVGTANEVTDLSRAAMLLGRKTISTLALSFALAENSLKTGPQGDLFKQFWSQSLLTGVAASVLSKRFGTSNPDEAFLVGLLSHIGRLGALSFAADEYRTNVEYAAKENISIDTLFLSASGMSCEELTLQYMRAWSLPVVFLEAIEAMQIASKADRKEGRASEAQDIDQTTVLRLAEAIGRFFTGENTGVSLATLHELLAESCDDVAAEVDRLNANVMEEAVNYGQLLEADFSNIPAPEELRIQAMSQLAEIMMQPDFVASAERPENEIDWLKQRVSQLSQKLTIDPMTRVYNRAHFEEALKQRVAAARLSNTYVGLLFVDINEFKQVNDNYGHDVGDAAIIAVANALNTKTRSTDVVARYGGDEFVVLCECNSRDGLHPPANRLAKDTANIVAECCNHEINLSIAIGGAIGMPHGNSFEAHLLKAADEAMYEAKKTRSSPQIRFISAATCELALSESA